MFQWLTVPLHQFQQQMKMIKLLKLSHPLFLIGPLLFWIGSSLWYLFFQIIDSTFSFLNIKVHFSHQEKDMKRESWETHMIKVWFHFFFKKKLELIWNIWQVYSTHLLHAIIQRVTPKTFQKSVWILLREYNWKCL